jgi:hypothetical protein
LVAFSSSDRALSRSHQFFEFSFTGSYATVPQSKFETCVESLDSRGFFDEAGYKDDPGKKISIFFKHRPPTSHFGHFAILAILPFWPFCHFGVVTPL